MLYIVCVKNKTTGLATPPCMRAQHNYFTRRRLPGKCLYVVLAMVEATPPKESDTSLPPGYICRFPSELCGCSYERWTAAASRFDAAAHD